MMMLLSIFGGLALVLASVGIYGSSPSQCRNEPAKSACAWRWGAACGRAADDSDGRLKLVAVGVVLGVAAALMLTRLLEGMVYGVSMRDPLIFVLVDLLMVRSRWRHATSPHAATRVDPITPCVTNRAITCTQSGRPSLRDSRSGKESGVHRRRRIDAGAGYRR